MKILTHDEVIAALRKRQGSLTLRQFALKLDLSAAYLSDVYRKNREPGKKILKHLGLSKESTRSTIYFEMNGAKR